jgi:hypothetical protein
MTHKAMVVFTAKGIERVIREGGTSAWRLDRKHARQCSFAVCTRNANAKWVEGTETHHSAFLVGKVRDVLPCLPTPENEEAAENRYLIQFSEFARVNIPNVWKGDRNPIKYAALEDLGIDPSTLTWEAMPESAHRAIEQVGAEKSVSAQPLTIAEAKRGLARTFNISPDAIEITVRG